jgi:hypothetical protein
MSCALLAAFNIAVFRRKNLLPHVQYRTYLLTIVQYRTNLLSEPNPKESKMPALERASQVRPQPTKKDISAAGLRAFFNISRDWALSEQEQLILLGQPSRSTYYKWKSAPETADVKRDTLERLSYVLGVYKALQILLPDLAAADAWVKKPNTAPLLGGKSALDRMLGGNVGDLLAVRQYLDAQRGGWA